MKKKSNIKKYILFAICSCVIASTAFIINSKIDLLDKIWYVAPWVLVGIFMSLWMWAKKENSETERKHSIRRLK
jgi:hypothetical protein